MPPEKRTILRIFALFFTVTMLASCASVPKPPQTRLPSIPVAVLPQPAAPIRHDIIHIVAPGETLWRISRIYDVKPKEIMRVNSLSRPDKIKLGQTLRIPEAAPPRPVIHCYPSDKWKYIIIHHSATDNGNALYFDGAHKKRGFERGLGYHFVIDNGTVNKEDGFIEVSPRWIKQQNGAHCSASGMNYKGIGICLVGNFEKTTPSDEQMNSLTKLVKMLKKYYKIPSSRILGHNQVPRATTACPGRNFPWEEFRDRIRG